MASKSSSSQSSSQQNLYDNRQVTTVDDRDTTTNTSSSYDLSNRSVTTVNNTSTDPGIVRIAELQSQLAGAVAETGNDTLKAVAGLGASAFNDLTGSLSNISSSNERAWSHTVDAASGVIEGLLTTAKDSTDAAKSLAASAIASYQPSDNKTADTFKAVGIAAAVALGLGFALRA